MEVVIDGGANCTVISKTLFDRINSAVTFQPQRVLADTSSTTAQLQLDGYAYLSVTVHTSLQRRTKPEANEQRTVLLKVFVSSTLSFPMMLGNDYVGPEVIATYHDGPEWQMR